MNVVIADTGAFDGLTPHERPTGGVEAAVVQLAEALVAEGAAVRAFAQDARRIVQNGVAWRPLADGLDAAADLYIANRSNHLLPEVPGAKRMVFALHNPGRYLAKPRYLKCLWRRRPTLTVSGRSHERSLPWSVRMLPRMVSPLGEDPLFAKVERPADLPPPVAVFTSNPMRGLDWLLDLWIKDIHPRAPAAELHIYSGPAVYGAAADKWRDRALRLLDDARAAGAFGVRVFDPAPKARLAEIMSRARLMAYRGDPGETFCLALGEAQSAGVPVVVMNEGAVVERLTHGETGFAADTPQAFAEHAAAILNDDAVFTSFSAAARARSGRWTWADAARAHLALIEKGA